MESIAACAAMPHSWIAVVGVLAGLIVGLVHAGIAHKQIRELDATAQEGVKRLKEVLRSEGEGEARKSFEEDLSRGAVFYEQRRRAAFATARHISWSLGVSLTALLFCAGEAFFAETATCTLMWTVLAFLPAASVVYFWAIQAGEWRRFPADSESGPYVWLYFVLPFAAQSHRLDIVAGTLNPEGFKEPWLFEALGWLRNNNERRVNVRMLAGKPDFMAVKESDRARAREQWAGVRRAIEREGLSDSLLLAAERPSKEFTVCSGLVRIEESHMSWTQRPAELVVHNDVWVGDTELERVMSRRFDNMWRTAQQESGGIGTNGSG